LFDFDILRTTKEGTAAPRKVYVSIHNSLKYHRNVTKQTNPLHVDNLSKNTYVAILEAFRGILKKQRMKISVFPNVIFFKIV
jgi:hypothetical protein